MAFQGAPRILRLFGRGHVARVDTTEFEELYDKHFRRHHRDTESTLPVSPNTSSSDSLAPVSELYELEGASQIRGIIVADIHKVGTSCGWGVPFYEYKSERPTLRSFWGKRPREQLAMYWAKANTQSLDGLPGMRHELMGPEWAPASSEASDHKHRFNFFGAIAAAVKGTAAGGSARNGDVWSHLAVDCALVIAGFGAGVAASVLAKQKRA
ncbi:hypothetical protein BGX26_005321 [Mortierella sp. AD094]|nr:hypothetical protein BGX26_005321 [Mortierella sp. AD094]